MKASFRALRRTIGYQTAAVVLGGLLLLFLSGWVDHRQVRLDAKRDQANLLTAIAEHALWTLESAESMLDQVQREVQSMPADASATDLHAALKKIQVPHNEDQIWFVASGSGQLLTTTTVAIPTSVSVSDRDYFRFHSARRSSALFVGQLVKTRGTQVWSFTLTRGEYDGKGELQRVVGTTLRLPYFLNFYGALQLGDKASVVLARDDGELLVRYPFRTQDVGATLPTLVAWLRDADGAERKQAQSRYFTSALDGEARLGTMKRVPGYPVVAVVTTSVDHLMAGWRQRQMWRLAVLLLSLAVVGSLAWALWKRTVQLEQSAEQALVDRLTGLPNRHAFEERLSRTWQHALREGKSMALLMVDVDHFKAYNDEFGHAAGDACLQQVAKLLKAHPRRGIDLLARWGGEEFACILPDCALSVALRIAEAMRASVEAAAIPHPALGPSAVVTISVGVDVETPRAGLAPSELLMQADAALYRAKREGRNAVRVRTP